jgi:tetratricopeptide (TPR) repeat protein
MASTQLQSTSSTGFPTFGLQTLIERDADLTRLKALWQDARDGHGHVVLLAGEAGTGKTSLAGALIKHVETSSSAHKIARTACSAQCGRDEAFWPFAEAFAQLSANRRRKVTEDVFDSLLETAPEWISMIPVAGSILGASIKTAQLIRAKAKSSNEPNPEKLLREYVAALQQVSAKTPVLIVIDDLHWCDDASIKLLSHLSRHLQDLHVLVIGAYRPSDIAVDAHPLNTLIDDIVRYDRDGVITLPALSETGVSRLIDNALAPNKFPKPFGPHIHRNTGGSPLFVVETLQLMRTQGEIFKDNADNKWAVQAKWEDDLPRSVEAVIEDRVNRLPAELLEILSIAAVQGATFDAAVLAYVLDQDEVQLMRTLEPAERTHSLISYVGDVELDADITARFRFASNLFHRELLSRLRGKQRMLVYRKTAEGIDRLWPDDNEDLAARLAELFTTGKVYERAAFFSIVAARKCRKAGQVATAIQLLEEGERMLTRSGQSNAALSAEIDDSLGALYELDAAYDHAAQRTLRAAAAGPDALGWRSWAALHTRLARLADHDGRFSDMLTVLEAVRVAMPDDAHDRHSLEAAQVSAEYTRALVRVSRADEALTHCEEALARTSAMADPSVREHARVMLHGAQAMALYFNGQYDRCLSVAEEALPVAKRRSLTLTTRGLLISLVNWCVTVGAYERARAHIADMSALAQAISDEGLGALVHLLYGKILTMSGEHERALVEYAAAEVLVGQVKSFAWEAELLAMKAWSLVDRRELESARALLLRAGPIARRSGSREWVGYVQLVQARHALANDDFEAALNHAETAQQIFREENARYDVARSERVKARCYRALDRPDKAAASFNTALRLFEQFGNQQQVELTQTQMR